MQPGAPSHDTSPGLRQPDRIRTCVGVPTFGQEGNDATWARSCIESECPVRGSQLPNAVPGLFEPLPTAPTFQVPSPQECKTKEFVNLKDWIQNARLDDHFCFPPAGAQKLQHAVFPCGPPPQY